MQLSQRSLILLGSIVILIVILCYIQYTVGSKILLHPNTTPKVSDTHPVGVYEHLRLGGIRVEPFDATAETTTTSYEDKLAAEAIAGLPANQNIYTVENQTTTTTPSPIDSCTVSKLSFSLKQVL